MGSEFYKDIEIEAERRLSNNCNKGWNLRRTCQQNPVCRQNRSALDVHEWPESKMAVDFSMVEVRKEWSKESRNSRKVGAKFSGKKKN